jgi:uncharacterized protein involved in exopolysaccharide biosynthesis
MGNIDIGFYISILMRRLPYVLVIALTVLVAAVAGTRYMPRVYRADAKILAEAPQIPSELARSTVPISGTAQLQILKQQMTTRDALLALATKLDIYGNSPVKPGDEDIVSDLSSRIKFDELQLDSQNPGLGIAVYAVSFSAGDPVLAAKVANEIVSMILARNQRERTDRAGSTLDFFNQKVAGLDADLKRLEAEILKFTNLNKDTLPESLDYRRSRQSSLQERLLILEGEESDLRRRRNTIIVSYAGTGQITGAIALTPEQQMLADLNRVLVEQLAIFTEDSSNIKAIRARIAKLQQSLATGPMVPAAGKDAVGGTKMPLGLELQLSDVDSRLQAIDREKRFMEQQIDALSRSIAATPATESALNALMRNRENIQTQYNLAIARRAEASTGAQIEIRSDGQRFSLLESAEPPAKPVSPNRRLIVLLAGVGGLGAGLGFVVMLEFLNKAVRRPKELTMLLQYEPLGIIPVVKSPSEARVASRKLGLGVFLTVGMASAFLVAVYYYQAPLDLVIQRLVSGFTWKGAA